jgi:hypothetical protein
LKTLKTFTKRPRKEIKNKKTRIKLKKVIYQKLKLKYSIEINKTLSKGLRKKKLEIKIIRNELKISTTKRTNLYFFG